MTKPEFADIVRSEASWLKRLASSLTCSPADADDLFQETMVRAVASWARFDYQSDVQTRGWLSRIMRNTAIDISRARTRRPQSGGVLTEQLLPASHDPDPILADYFDRATLDQFEETVFLVDAAGWTMSDVARRDGVALGTVKSRLSRGRDRIRARELAAAG